MAKSKRAKVMKRGRKKRYSSRLNSDITQWKYDHPSMGFKENKLYYGFSLVWGWEELYKRVDKLKNQKDGWKKLTQYQIVQSLNPTFRGIYYDDKVIGEAKFINEGFWIKDPIDSSFTLINYKLFRELEDGLIQDITLSELLLRIVDTMKKYVYFQHKEQYYIYAIYLINSLCYRLYNYCPIFHFYANYGSGKTVAGKFGQFLTRGTYTIGITKSAFVRSLDIKRSPMIVDEKENIMDESNELPLILNGCFQRGSDTAMSTKTENDDWKASSFGLFCPVIICSVTPVYGATADRTIRFDMLRARKNEITRNILKDEKMPIWEELRCDILRYWIKNYKPVYDRYIDLNIKSNVLGNRVMDLWAPILNLAQMAEEESKKLKKAKLAKKILKYVETNFLETKQDSIASDYTYIMIGILNKFEDAAQLKASTIYQQFKSEVQNIDDVHRRVSMNLFGSIMKKIGYGSLDGTRFERKDGRYYIVSHDKNNEYLERYYYQEADSPAKKKMLKRKIKEIKGDIEWD